MYKHKVNGGKIEDPGNGPWFLKRTDEDGIFVKYEASRLKSATGDLTGKVLNLEVRQSAQIKDQDIVLVTCENFRAVSGFTKFSFAIKNFDCQASAFSMLFSNSKSNNKEFVNKFKQLTKGAKQSVGTSHGKGRAQAVAKSTPPVPKRPVKDGAIIEEGEMEDLISPAKKARRAETLDEEIAAQHLGKFKLRVDQLSDCPETWLDRPLDQEAVNSLVEKIKDKSALQNETQSWLAVASMSKDDLREGQTVKDLVKVCTIQVIGGRHRHAAYRKLRKQNDGNLNSQLDKVWVSIYSHKLTDEQVKRLAHVHNSMDEGSRKTRWVDRVKTCRNWAYDMAKKNYNEDTPESTQAWRKSCQAMFVGSEKDVASLEPTLQAALLTKPVWDLFVQVDDLYRQSELKGMSIKKPSRRLKLEIKQNQLGMPLQGLDESSKVRLLEQLTSKAISLEDFKRMAESIKKKKKVAEAFMRYSGSASWSELQKRFPRHATEEKLAQFTTLKLRGKEIPLEMENFFRRAMEIEQENDSACVSLRLQAEGECGVHYFENTEKSVVGAMVAGDISSLSKDLVTRLIPEFKGFALTLVTIPEDIDEHSLKGFITMLHSLNVGNVDCYNVIFHVVKNDADAVTAIRSSLGRIMSEVQIGYYIAKDGNITKGDGLLHNVVSTIVLGQWSRFGKLMDGNLIPREDMTNVFHENDALDKMVHLFSFKSQWVLDLSRTADGTNISSITNLERNCLCLCEDSAIRNSVRKAHVAVSKQGSSSTADDDDEDDEDDDLTMDQSENTEEMEQRYVRNIGELRNMCS